MMTMTSVVLAVLLVAGCAPEAAEYPTAGPSAGKAPSQSGRSQIPDGRAGAAWNELAYDIAFGEDQFLTFKGHRAFVMMNLAMHDALNTILPRYRRYAWFGDPTDADPIVAASQAAYEVLVSQYPGSKQRLERALAKWIEPAGKGVRTASGIELGKASAAAILHRRQGDKFDFPGSYQFRDGLGQYQTTPPWKGFVAQPGFAVARPFALDAPDRFRPPPPPSLRSAPYAGALEEVKDFGALHSKRRTPDQTGYAIWWMEFAEGSVNRLARELILERSPDLWVTTRLFAQINMTLYDGYIAVWNAKYRYNHWRPYTAIRAAGEDGNPKTAPDQHWTPLRDTPPHPEYVSAHAAGCAGSFDILRRLWGDHVRFTMKTTTAPPGMPTRTFTSFTAAARECADSRVRLGYHYRYSTDAGLELGRRVAAYVVKHYLEPK